MKKIILILLIFLLLLPNVSALATGDESPDPSESPEPTPVSTEEPVEESTGSVTFSIDTQHAYQGMDKSYAQGYVPSIANNTANVILPLILDENAVCDEITASLNLGDPATAPFVFKNYVNEFAMKSYSVDDGDASCYLVQFDLALDQDRINGSYPVAISVTGKTQDGVDITGEFMLYVVIQDGKEPGAEPTPAPTKEPAPMSQPKLIVNSYEYNPNPLKAGADCTMAITVKNTSTSQSVKNIKLSFQDASGDILPKDTSSVFIKKIAKGDSVLCNFALRVAEKASANPHVITITMEYEDSQAVFATATDTIILDVTQSIRLEYEQPSLPSKLTEGDNLSFSMNIMNLGKSTVYNVLLTFEIPGMNNGGSVLVGNMEPGESKAAATNLLVSSIDGDYGDVSGTIVLSYENESGKLFEQELFVQTIIDKKVEVVSTTEEEDEKKLSPFPWWVIIIAIIIFLVTAGLIIVKILKNKKQHQEDELRL